jgi:hypothetical protein
VECRTKERPARGEPVLSSLSPALLATSSASGARDIAYSEPTRAIRLGSPDGRSCLVKPGWAAALPTQDELFFASAVINLRADAVTIRRGKRRWLRQPAAASSSKE